MSDLDSQIRTAVRELIDAAPPPPLLPSISPTPERSPRRRPLLVGLAILVALVVLVTGATAVSQDSDNDSRVVTGTLPAPAVVSCGTRVGVGLDAGGDRTVFLHRLALTTRRTLQVSPSGDPDPRAALFAKDGLVVKELLPVQLIVPRGWRHRLSIGWGDSGRTTHLQVERCPGSKALPAGDAADQSLVNVPWNAWAGGYYVSKASCVPLIVKAGGKSRTVHISVGKRCPGQLR